MQGIAPFRITRRQSEGLSRRRADRAEAWPKTTIAGIAYNTSSRRIREDLEDLCKPEYGPKKIGQ